MKFKLSITLIVSIILIFAGSVSAQFISPGKLTNSHKELSGITKCVRCHTLGKGIPDSACKSCHKKLMARLKENKGFHAQVTGHCIDCHEEHKGEDYDVMALNKEKFDHSATGFALENKHKILCEKCHKTEKTYLGLKTECISCHKDVHQNTLTDCVKCHSFKGWKALRFEHNKYSQFKLTGKHTEVKCEGCHPQQAEDTAVKDRKVLKFKPLSFERCDSCHKPVHKEDLKQKACSSCHTTQGWKETKFDHNDARISNFSLQGKHEEASCELCHPQKKTVIVADGKEVESLVRQFKPIKHEKCNDCHFDVHEGQFKDKRCDVCHSVDKKWKENKFRHESGQYSGFKLLGKHKEVECEKCHAAVEISYTEFNKKKKASPWQFKPLKSEGCNDCHFDVHKGQFKDKRCDGCHTVENEWKKPIFRHEEQNVGFKLLGKHKEVECEKCHAAVEISYTEFNKKKKASPWQFKPLKSEGCNDCHFDVHKGQFKDKRCDGCHTVENEWKKPTFRHEDQNVGFRLLGKHKEVECEKCHKKSEINYREFNADKKALIGTFKLSQYDKCASCHQDTHKGLYAQDCNFCHSPSSWEPRNFLHDQASMELKGFHRTLGCRECHKEAQQFQGLDSECVSCHQPQEPHLNQFGPFCADCHRQEAWIPLNFKHTGIGFRLVGSHRSVNCDDCHTNRDYRNTPSDCIACHETDYQSAPDHLALGFSQDCTECHSPAKQWENVMYDHSSFTFSGAHASLKLDCDVCHASTYGSLQTGTTDNDCYNCHSLSGVSSLKYETVTDPPHSAMSFSTICTDCHSTSTWSAAAYSHQSIQLSGVHTTLQCNDCHESGYPGNFGGTAMDHCHTCHASAYQSAPNHVTFSYPEDCTTCHSGNAWTGASFTHQSFQLTGVHTTIDCTACHASGYPGTYAGATKDDCYTCHASDYQSATNHVAFSFPHDCTTCHSGNVWTSGSYTHQSFQLTGVHTTIDCTACHASGYPGTYAGATKDDCYTCHASDYQSATNHVAFSFPQDCTTCHSGNAWTGASFTHQSFQLTGVHTTIDCTACHASGYPGTYAGATKDDCYTCHASDYQLATNHAAFSFPHDCTTCHSGNVWTSGSYTHQSFQLTGVHTTIDCTACHASGYPGNYAGATKDDCYTCHASDYQSATNHAAFSFPHDCTTCHSGNVWTSGSYTHQSFQLTGVHTTIDCTACHASGYPGNYAGATKDDCYTCHASDYQSASNHTSRNYPHDCTNCHSGNTWSGASFAHESFSLRGIHTTLSCTACHSSGYPGNYAGTSDDDCYTCHRSDYEKEHRSGTTSHTCTNCHNLQKWD